MNKFNTQTAKKSLKPLLTISAIATLLIAAMSLTATPNANASFNFGLKSKDVNTGSIDTDSLFSCVGAAVNCINTNQNNNNEVANNTAVIGNGNGEIGNGNGEIFTCEECFQEHLTSEQLQSLIEVLPAVSTEAELCAQIEDGTITAEVLFSALVDRVGISDDQAMLLLECLGLELVVIG